jgi:hypothetical protein
MVRNGALAISPNSSILARMMGRIVMVRQYSNAECRTLTEAYARLGATIRNPRRTWSAMTDDGDNAILTLWSDLFTDVNRQIFDVFGELAGEWIHRSENRRRIEHLRYAGDKRAGVFYSIIVTSVNPPPAPRVILTREIGPRMKLTDLDERTGRFRAERLAT